MAGARGHRIQAVPGRLVTETSRYDGGRRVTAYFPPEPPEAIVFAGDGQLISQWGGLLEAAEVRSTMIVGAHRPADETQRLHEYSPGFDPERFASHERFFVEDVRSWVAARFGLALPAGRTAVFGVSASAELALAIGLRHPDVYGAILCASPGGGHRPPRLLPAPIPRTYLVAGTLERFFLANATRWADALRRSGADVVMAERHGAHGGAFWQDEFPLMVAWAFRDARIESVRPSSAGVSVSRPGGRTSSGEHDPLASVDQLTNGIELTSVRGRLDDQRQEDLPHRPEPSTAEEISGPPQR